MHYRETKPEANRKERNLGLNSLYKGEKYMRERERSSFKSMEKNF